MQTRKSPSSKGWLSRHSFLLLLVALLIMIIGSPFARRLGQISHYLGGEESITPFVLLLTLAAGAAVWPTAKSRAATIILGGTVLIFLYLSTVFTQDSLVAIHLIGQTIFLFYVIAVITRIVFSAVIVDGNILCGAACLYLLVGVLFGFVYSLIFLFEPSSFHLPTYDVAGAKVPTLNPGWLIYFSFATLTTVSFGDILPAAEASRSIATLEAIVGQIMIVLMMARLVGLHVAQSTSMGKNQTIFEVGDEEERPPRHRPKD